MDASPYTPGAGHRPPVLAGRDDLLRAWRTGLNDVAAVGRQRAPDTVLTAPRGAGKTATVLAFQDLCQTSGFEVVRLQAATGNATLVDSLLRRAIARAEDGSGPWERARRAFDRLAGVSLTVGGIAGVGITTRERRPPESHAASPEDLADALATLAREVRKDRRAGGVLITVDEIQSAAPSDLSLLAAGLQGLNAEYPDARVMFAASGLPNTFQAFEDAKVTHADRLFKFKPIPPILAPDDARYAVVEAARQHNVAWQPEAAELIVEVSRGYPPHLQAFADQTWLAADGPNLITVEDAHRGVEAAARALEENTLAPRFDSLTARQRELLVALAASGGRATTANLAITLGRTQASLSEFRDQLIRAGDVYVPQRGELALTVPVFGPYLLANYEQARPRTTTSLLPLEEMRRNLEAIQAVQLARAGQPLPPGSATSRSAPSSTAISLPRRGAPDRRQGPQR